MHLLGYFLDTDNKELIRETTRYQQNRTDRVHGLVRQLNSIGVALHADQVFDLAKVQGTRQAACGPGTGEARLLQHNGRGIRPLSAEERAGLGS